MPHDTGRKVRDLDFHKLEIFYWVTELQNFSLAAEHLSLSQPTVSVHVQDLEEQVGSKLLTRRGGIITPTVLGRVLRDHAVAFLNLKSESIAAIQRLQGGPKGDLLVGGSNIPGEYILPGKLGEFIVQFPEVKPILQIADSAKTVEAVMAGLVEVGFVGYKNDDRRLSFQKKWRDEMILAVPGSHRWARMDEVALAELRGQPFISREGGSGTLKSFYRLLRQKGQEPERLLHIIMELGSTAAIKEALIGGLGISILSRTSIRREVEDGLIREVQIRGLKLERQFYQVTFAGRPLSTVARTFIQFLARSST